ncbi:MAG: hypothetical protein GXO59_05025, partial [Dictyoglomi bacterium]|nr:hypothetical protein [Dictyoglomota bacterium]
MSWTIVSLLILAYVWYSLYKAIRKEGRIKTVVWAVVIILAVGMMIPAGNLTQWGKGSWPLIFDRPQIQDQNKPLYSEVFPFKEKPAVIVSWNAIADEIDMLGNEAYSLQSGSIVDWKTDVDAQKFLMDKLGKDKFCIFVDVYNHFENQNVEVSGCPVSRIGNLAPEEIGTWIDKNADVRAALLDDLKILSGEVATQLEPKVKDASSQIKGILADLGNIKVEDNSSVEDLQNVIATIDNAISRINSVKADLETMAGGNFKDLEIVVGVVDDITTRLDEVKGYVDKLITAKQNIDMMASSAEKDKYIEEYNKNLGELRKVFASLPKELEFALSGMENVVTTLKEMGPAVDIIKNAKWYQVKLDNEELFEKMGGIEGYAQFMRQTIKKYAEKNGIQGPLDQTECMTAKSEIKQYVQCEYTKTYVDKQLKVCPASVFFNTEGTAGNQGQSSGYKEELLGKIESNCAGIEDVTSQDNNTNPTESTQVSQNTCTVSDTCACNAAEGAEQTQQKSEAFKTYVVINDGKKEKKVLIENFVPSQNVCRDVMDRFDTSFDKVFNAVFDNMYCGGATVNIASLINPYFGTRSYYIVSEQDRKPLKVLNTRGLIEMNNANKPNPTGVLIFTIILALIIGGMEIMLRLFLPPIISS